MLNRLKSMISRGPSVRAEAGPMAYVLHPDGRMTTIKSTETNNWGPAGGGYGYAGAGNYMPLNATPEGFAAAYTASVWAYRCIEIRCQILGQLPFTVIDKRSKEEVPEHPLARAIQRSKHNIIRKVEWSRLLWGEVFLRPRRNPHGYHSDISWLNNLAVDVDTATGYIAGFSYFPINGGRPHYFQSDQMCYIYTDNPWDDLRGLSRFEAVLVEVGIDREIARTTRAFYVNDSRPGIILIPKYDMNQAQSQEFMDWWKLNLTGSKNANKPILVPSVISDIKEMQRAPSKDDAELRASTRREICAGFGVPLSVAGAWDDANYQSAPEQRKSLYIDTIIPAANDIASEINKKLMPFFDDPEKYALQFDITGLLELIQDDAVKQDVLDKRLYAGAISLNDYRREIGEEPLEGGDVHYVPEGYAQIPADKVGDPYIRPDVIAAERLAAGGITLNEYRTQVGLEPIEKGNVVYVPASSIQVPADQIGEIFSKPSYVPYSNPSVTLQQAQGLARQQGTDLPPPPPAETNPADEAPAEVVQEAEAETPDGEEQPAGRSLLRFDNLMAKSSWGTADASVILSVDRGDIYDLLSALFFEFPEDAPIRWQEGLHITMASTPMVDHEPLMDTVGALSQLRHLSEALLAGPMVMWQKDGYDCLVVPVQDDVQLTYLQEGVVNTFENLRVPLSPYSKPENWKPHVTLAYGAPGVFDELDLTRSIGLRIITGDLVIARGSHQTVVSVPPEPIKTVRKYVYGLQLEHECCTKHATVEDELKAWERKAAGKSAAKALDFACYVVPAEMQDYIRASLPDAADKHAVYAVFNKAREMMPAEDREEPPAEYVDYWRRYDAVREQIGEDWLEAYMREAWPSVQTAITGDNDVEAIMGPLLALHERFVEEWVGTRENPGSLTRMFYAGAAAGNVSLQQQDPDAAAPPVKAEITLDVDWSLLSEEAVDYVREYAFDLISRLDDTTRDEVRTAIERWLRGDQELESLKAAMEEIFNNPVRAEMIAQTESTRAYHEGAERRWKEAGVTKQRWRSVRDSLVSDICRELDGKVGTLEEGFYSTVLNQYVKPPAHVRCRSYTIPILD